MWNCVEYEQLGSTNDKAKELTLTAHGQKLAVTAQIQTAGRGRRGRTWQSFDGNLFLSLALPFELKDCTALVFMTSIALLQTIKNLCSKADVKLKWPNDVLLNGAKVSGILLEKGEGDYMIAGIGVNLKTAPKTDIIYPTISLNDIGVDITPLAFRDKYLENFDALCEIFAKQGIVSIAKIWQTYAKGIGNKIIVKTAKEEKKGIFVGLNDNGMLMLKTPEKIEIISAGDVFFVDDERKEENDK